MTIESRGTWKANY